MSSHMVCGSGTRWGPSSLLWCACLPHRGALSPAHGCARVAPKWAFLPPMVCLPPAPRGLESEQGVRETETIATSNFLLGWGGEGRSWGSLFFRRASPENLSGGDGDVHPPFDPNRDIRDIGISLWSGREGGTGWGRVVLPSESLVGDSPESRRSTAGEPNRRWGVVLR
ncbi:hypothetical protein V6N11_028520 [Hibiscus sabdariffa]|uniref:Uncharacterized protein n=1 Tax=Hibiscus sabdariffa TaxID=183260 RepID=A0ABR2NEH5_9ROSI